MATVEHVDIGGNNRRLTPMLLQYLEAKKEAPQNAILMFRMGDFFELFFEDAKIAAKELDLTLTARDKSDNPIPMAGVPHHAVDGYIAKLVERGYTVALCDQVEDARAAKGLVKRQITRLITPGTRSDLEALDPSMANYLACVVCWHDKPSYVSIALLDLLAGELLYTHCMQQHVHDELHRLAVSEVLLDTAAECAIGSMLTDSRIAKRLLKDTDKSAADACRFLQQRFSGNAHVDTTCLKPEDAQALMRLLLFAESTQKQVLTHVLPPKAYQTTDFLVLDEATRANLELCITQRDQKKQGSLLWHINRCKTAMGSRLLHQWLLFPLRDIGHIEARLETVAYLTVQRTCRQALQACLQDVRDLERLMGRLAVGRCNPRDMALVRTSLLQMPQIESLWQTIPTLLAAQWKNLPKLTDLTDTLVRALVDDPPLQINDAGIFAQGYCPKLDALIVLSNNSHAFLLDLEQRERARTGIHHLKVHYNRVFGYYIEVGHAHTARVPNDYIRKQTLANAERFITEELKDFEYKILQADGQRKIYETQLFNELVQHVGAHATQLRAWAHAIAQADTLCSLAQVADEGRYTQPVLCQEQCLDLQEARHPVIECLLPGGERFVPNDIQLDTAHRQLMIMTGPNMAGKSTVMRQTALCIILAHMGSFVPAKSARIGLCDRLFTRVGASDNLGRGHSTFMVEMLETATILACATKQSFVLLDEIGRGTSTFDGISIAWSVVEHLHDTIGCRTIFATHYHELTHIGSTHMRVVNTSMAVEEKNGEVIFLRRLVQGAANQSYGIQVARLAGLPDQVIKRAHAILATLENGRTQH